MFNFSLIRHKEQGHLRLDVDQCVQPGMLDNGDMGSNMVLVGLESKFSSFSTLRVPNGLCIAWVKNSVV